MSSLSNLKQKKDRSSRSILEMLEISGKEVTIRPRGLLRFESEVTMVLINILRRNGSNGTNPGEIDLVPYYMDHILTSQTSLPPNRITSGACIVKRFGGSFPKTLGEVCKNSSYKLNLLKFFLSIPQCNFRICQHKWTTMTWLILEHLHQY